MDYIGVQAVGADTAVTGVRNFDLNDILDCGQCFRWTRLGDRHYSGVAMGRSLEISQQGDRLLLRDTSPEEFRRVWHRYFDFERDYTALGAVLSRDAAMAEAIAFCPGMRVVRQEPWEALCSFIISQNNNIPRIKGIIARLCECFGQPLAGGAHAFPTPGRLAGLEPEELAVIRSGFRAKYILDAARLVAGGELDLASLGGMETAQARAQLLRIRGVGPKVAECALLYGLGRAECMPVDVWIARALEQLYPSGFPEQFSDCAGIGQQYLFHYMRNRERAAAKV